MARVGRVLTRAIARSTLSTKGSTYLTALGFPTGRSTAKIKPAAGSAIIPNPVNRIPGFSLGEHHFVPGFPQMAWPMVEWVLDTKYRDRFDSQKWKEQSILVYEAGESQLIFAMKDVEAGFQGVKVFSLASMGQDGSRIHVELGVRGDPVQVKDAMEALRLAVKQAGFPYK